MRIPPVLVALAATLVSACGGDDNEPRPISELDLEIPDRQLDLGEFTYKDTVIPPQSVLFSNNDTEALYVIFGLYNAEGEGASLLSSSFTPMSVVLPDQSRPIPIQLDKRTWRWKTGDYTVQIPLEVSYFFVPSTGIFSIEQPLQRIKDVTSGDASIEVSFSLNCDLDGDGFDAIECGGMDCNDGNANIAPDAEEDCFTSFDDDCDGAVNDPDALNATTFYADVDLDGYGDSADTLNACRLPPTGSWSLIGGDCDDDDGLASPGKTIETRCNDGRDDDCNGLTDAADPACAL